MDHIFNFDEIQHLKQIRSVKRFDKWVPREQTKNKKTHCFEVYLLSFYAITTNHFLIRLWHVMKSGFYTTTRDNQLSSWIKKQLQSTAQSQTCTKKGHGYQWSAAGLIHYSSQNPAETITTKKHVQQIDKIYWKPPCLQPALVNRKGPILLHNNAWPHIAQSTLQKLNELSYKVLPDLPYSPHLLSINYHFFNHLDNFFQGKCFHNQQEAELPRVHGIILKHRFLHYRNKPPYFSLEKICWL